MGLEKSLAVKYVDRLVIHHRAADAVFFCKSGVTELFDGIDGTGLEIMPQS